MQAGDKCRYGVIDVVDTCVDLTPSMDLQFPAEETIVAPATAIGGGVAMVRLSGSDAIAVAERLFRPHGAQKQLADRQLIHGTLSNAAGEIVDDCLAVVMRRPHSFTGEDVAEIHCHGGQAVVAAVIDACVEAGARMAEPGEFSRRAFLNGQMDLAQAEALGDLIAAQTQLSRQMALRQLRGGLSAEVRGVRDGLVDAAAEIEAHLDFPEEDIPALSHGRIVAVMNDSGREISRLLGGFERGRIVREGARVVLAGLPNAGKSRLFNALVGRERAIVSPHPGTTRDTIECTIDVRGVPVTLIDTAGLRDSVDEVEQIGIARTSEEMRGADLLLMVVDVSSASEESVYTTPVSGGPAPVLLVLNKTDLAKQGLDTHDPNAFLVSAATKEGVDALLDAIADKLIGRDVSTEASVTRARHAECLRLARESLEKAHNAFAQMESGELVMVDLRDAIIHLGEILGERLDEQILDRIFSTFCLGK